MLSNQQSISRLLFWTARILGSAILVFLLFFVLAHIFGSDESGEGFRNAREIFLFACFPLSSIIGLALAYKNELIGSLVSLLGAIAFILIEPSILSSVYFMLVPLSALLYLGNWILSKRLK